MADSIRIGRLVYSDAEPRKGTLLSASGSGDTIDIDVLLEGVTTADLILWRNMASNTDESWVPVAFAARPDLDGFYAVTDAQVEQSGDMDGDGTVQVSASLLRSPSSERPIAEITLLQNERATEYGFTSAAGGGFVGIPLPASQPATMWLENPFLGAGAEVSADLSDGVNNVDIYRLAWVGREMARYVPGDPADWYVAAPTITVNDLPVVGRRAMWASQDPSTDIDWVLDNGLVRVTVAMDGTPAPTKLGVQTWLPSQAWSAVKYFEFVSITTSNPKLEFWPVAVLVNTPVLAGLRFAFTTSNGIPYTIDVTLRRGALMVDVVVHHTAAVGVESVGVVTPDAATDISDGTDVIGLRATSADAESLFWVIATNESVVTDNANGQIEPPFPQAYDSTAVGIGLTESITGTDDTDNALGMCLAWLYPVGERIDIVGA
jgi:hypothetical protein